MTTPADFMHPRKVATLLSTVCLFLLTTIPLYSAAPTIELPLDRTTYFQGEVVPMGVSADKAILELTGVDNDDQAVVLYKGPPSAVLLSTTSLEPGHYRLAVDGELTTTEFTVASPIRHSAASLQDEFLPPLNPRMHRTQRNDPEIRAKMIREHRAKIRRALEESGVSACVALGAAEADRYDVLDLLAEYGVMALNNPETRPTSFNPVANDQTEIEHMSQRMALTAQANARYPNFGGFCFGWDAAGFSPDMRQGLLFYWGWGDQEQPLRNYLQHIRDVRDQAFVEQTGLEVPSESDFLTYLMAINRPEFATYIDMPTRDWIYEIAAEMPKAQESEVANLARRTKAYADFLNTLYDYAYSRYQQNLRGIMPSLRNTSSVQIDHCPIRYGQYTPNAYKSLDFQYQTTWNDQVGGPDYAYQWLLTQAILGMNRGEGSPTWISNAFGDVHGRSRGLPGKFVKVSAHGLAHGTSGNGFAHEAFSNLLGGMNRHSDWESIRGTAAAAGVVAGRDFLDRFAVLALEGSGDHGVGILYSKSQMEIQHVSMGYGKAPYWLLASLTRLGYTPRFVTEEELAEGTPLDLDALVVCNQTVELSDDAMAGLQEFTKAGGRIITGQNTTLDIPGAEKTALELAFTLNGKPHSMDTPNLTSGDNPRMRQERVHRRIAPILYEALGETGSGLLKSAKGTDSWTSLMQIDGGRDAQYVVAVNESYIETQADWFQIKEHIEPTGQSGAARLYDCTAETELGDLKPFDCDLTDTTARVYAILDTPLGAIDLRATQSVKQGSVAELAVKFFDTAEKPLAAVIPFHIELLKPNGDSAGAYYRSTDRSGNFGMQLPIGGNATVGEWLLTLRCQLDGRVVTLPITVEAGGAGAQASRLAQATHVRDPQTIRNAFPKGTTAVLPLFMPAQADLLESARTVKAAMEQNGVTVDIVQYALPAPEKDTAGDAAEALKQVGTYWLAYDNTEAMDADNKAVEAGEVIGRIKRTTVSRNDWYSGASGYRSAKPVILLDVPETGDNPMAEQLNKLGALWPQMSAAYPGPDGAVLQVVEWAYGPQVAGMVIQALNPAGFAAAADTLQALPESDPVSDGIASIRNRLWEQRHIGSKPSPRTSGKLTSTGKTVKRAPRPFAIDFQDVRPKQATEVQPAIEPEFTPAAHDVPGVVGPKEMVPYDNVDGQFIRTSTAGVLLPDLRFSKGLLLVVDAPREGPMKVSMDGLFRYSDRQPRSQASWEDVLALYENIVGWGERKPMRVDVMQDDKVVAVLKPTKREEKEVPLKTLPSYVKTKPPSSVEEVVSVLSGDVKLSQGRNELLLVPRNVVDGRLHRVRIGTDAEAADEIGKEK